MENLLFDVHTHTISSGHAYSTLTENMRAASEKGLKIVGMTDHGPQTPGGCDLHFFKNLCILPDEMFGVKLLKGVEANILDHKGTMDIPDNILKGLDIVVASLHGPCVAPASKEVVTEGIIKIMENPYVNIIGHPGDARYPLDFKKLALASKRTGTLLEVNNAALTPNTFKPGFKENVPKMLKYCKMYRVPIIIGSDAHYHEEVGVFTDAIALIKSLDFPEELIINTNAEAFLDYISVKRKNALAS